MEDNLNWAMFPLEGGSGQAYLGTRKKQKIFIKRNATPFIPTLSAEGLVPRLLWTQQTYSGDLLTAQEWRNARQLQKEEITNQAVIDLIRHIHTSDTLLRQLKRIQPYIFKPLDFIDLYFKNLPASLMTHQFFNQVIQHLEASIDEDFYQCPFVVCHGDLNHNNFLVEEDGTLLLVDWEEVKIADPISDLTWFLLQYLPPSQWSDWLNRYQLRVDEGQYKRIRWYSLINCLLLIKQHTFENRPTQVNHYVLLLRRIFDY